MKKLTFRSLLLFITVTITINYSQAKKRVETDSINALFACPIAQTMPEFPGGSIEMMKFINQNLRWPKTLDESCIEGRVVVKFLVEATGELSNIQVVRSLHKDLDGEAIRVVKLMPKWIPGQMNGKNVSCYYTLPVLFRLTR